MAARMLLAADAADACTGRWRSRRWRQCWFPPGCWFCL